MAEEDTSMNYAELKSALNKLTKAQLNQPVVFFDSLTAGTYPAKKLSHLSVIDEDDAIMITF